MGIGMLAAVKATLIVKIRLWESEGRALHVVVSQLMRMRSPQ